MAPCNSTTSWPSYPPPPPTSSDDSSSPSPPWQSTNSMVVMSPIPQPMSCLKQLDSANLQLQLRIHMEHLFEQGLLDYYFRQLEMVEASGNPGFVVETIDIFCIDVERIIRRLENLLAEERADFPLLNIYICKIRGASGSVGCPTIGRTCINFKDFSEAGDKEGCIEAFRLVKCEFYRMQENLNYIVQLRGMIKACKEAEKEDSGTRFWELCYSHSSMARLSHTQP